MQENFGNRRFFRSTAALQVFAHSSTYFNTPAGRVKNLRLAFEPELLTGGNKMLESRNSTPRKRGQAFRLTIGKKICHRGNLFNRRLTQMDSAGSPQAFTDFLTLKMQETQRYNQFRIEN
jgi:hypothetical protein